MLLDPAALEPRDFYRHMISAITPRPIAWVSTVGADGVANLAPYSFFNGVSASPPALMFAPVNNRDGQKKHTLLNIEATRQFVVNVVSHRLAERMNATSAEFPREVSEFSAVGVAEAACQRVAVPRVADAAASFECELLHIYSLGDGPLAGHVVVGKILLLHVDPSVMDGTGGIDPARLDTIGRMGGSLYSTTRDRFELGRPG